MRFNLFGSDFSLLGDLCRELRRSVDIVRFGFLRIRDQAYIVGRYYIIECDVEGLIGERQTLTFGMVVTTEGHLCEV